jgi:PHP family Zn ribbon phosphoesterase
VASVWKIYNELISKFGNEYAVLIDASKEELISVTELKIAEAILKVRKGRARVIPGYDGVYGQLILFEDEKTAKANTVEISQRNLKEWCSNY